MPDRLLPVCTLWRSWATEVGVRLRFERLRECWSWAAGQSTQLQQGKPAPLSAEWLLCVTALPWHADSCTGSPRMVWLGSVCCTPRVQGSAGAGSSNVVTLNAALGQEVPPFITRAEFSLCLCGGSILSWVPCRLSHQQVLPLSGISSVLPHGWIPAGASTRPRLTN